MKKACFSCGAMTEISDLIRCQSSRHRDMGDAFCQNCVKQIDERLVAPFHCDGCCRIAEKARRRAEKRQRQSSETSKEEKRTQVRKAQRSRHRRLVRLRKRLGIRQVEMAAMLGSSRRQYQDWEYDELPMPLTAKLLCWYICMHSESLNDLAKDWIEGEQQMIDNNTRKNKETKR